MKRKHIVTLALLLSIALLALYLGARNSDAYGKAARFVARDARVTSLIGAVKNVEFRFWHGFTYTGDHADFSFQTTSGKGDFVVDVRLLRKVGAWCIQDADIRTQDGAEIFILLQ